MNTTDWQGQCAWLYEPEHLAEDFRELREIVREFRIKLGEALDELYEVSSLLEEHLTPDDDDNGEHGEDGGEYLFPEPVYDGPPPPKYELSTNGLWAMRIKD